MSFIQPKKTVEKDFEVSNIDQRYQGFGKFLDNAFNNPYSQKNISGNLEKIDKGQTASNVSVSESSKPYNPMDEMLKNGHSIEYNLSPNSVFGLKRFFNPDSEGSVKFGDSRSGKFDFNC